MPRPGRASRSSVVVTGTDGAEGVLEDGAEAADVGGVGGPALGREQDHACVAVRAVGDHRQLGGQPVVVEGRVPRPAVEGGAVEGPGQAGVGGERLQGARGPRGDGGRAGPVVVAGGGPGPEDGGADPDRPELGGGLRGEPVAGEPGAAVDPAEAVGEDGVAPLPLAGQLGLHAAGHPCVQRHVDVGTVEDLAGGARRAQGVEGLGRRPGRGPGPRGSRAGGPGWPAGRRSR